MQKHSMTAAVLANLPFIVLHAPAVATPATPAIAAAAQPAAAMATVTVSGARQARRAGLEDDPQRTPTSSYRIGGDELEEQNITTIEELQQLVPGLNIQNTDPSDMQISIRGVGDYGSVAGWLGSPRTLGVTLGYRY